jgi:hypothetical protein
MTTKREIKPEGEQAIPPEYAGQTVLGKKILLFEQHVEVELDNGMTKTISIADFQNALARCLNVEEETRGFLMPANCFFFAIGITEIKLSCFYPGRKRRISFSPGGSRGGKTEYVIPFPNIIISHKLKRNAGKADWTASKYIATSKPITQIPLKFVWDLDPVNQLWSLPFSNIYEDGRLCYGGNSVPKQFVDNFRGLDWHFAVLYNSPFNHDLGVRNTTKSWGVDSWYAELERHEIFPYEFLQYGQKATVSKAVAADLQDEETITDGADRVVTINTPPRVQPTTYRASGL